MAKKLTSAIGIDVGSQNIKIAEVKLQGGQPTITALGLASTPENAVDHTGLYEGDAVAAVLKEAIPGSGASCPDCVLTVAGQSSVLVRVLEVPRMNPNELKDHMQWEISRNIPFAESSVLSDFQSFPPDDAASTNLDVVMAIAPQSAVDVLVGMAKKAGKRLVAIDVEPLAIARSVHASYQDVLAGQTICTVEFGNKTSSINIYRDGQLKLPRLVPIGGEMLTKALSEGLTIELEEAEHLKVQKARIPQTVLAGGSVTPSGATQQFAPYNPFGDPADVNPGLAIPGLTMGGEETPEPSEPAEPEPTDEPPVEEAPLPAPSDDAETIKIYNAMAVVLEEFVAEVRRSIDYYRSKGGSVDQLLVLGGGARLPGLAEFLGNALGIPAGVYNAFNNIPVSLKRPTDLETTHAPDFAVAVGNALHIMFD